MLKTKSYCHWFVLFIMILITTRVAYASVGVLMVDTSGSLQASDADASVRAETVKRFLFLVGKGDNYFSIVFFGDTAWAAQPVTRITDKSIEDFGLVIKNIPTEGTTEIGLGLETGYQELSGVSEQKQYAILISDGEINASSSHQGGNEQALRELREVELARYVTSRIPVFTIGIAGPILDRRRTGLPTGRELLEEIAKRTGGQFYEAFSVQELTNIFKKILIRIPGGPVMQTITDSQGKFEVPSKYKRAVVAGPKDMILKGPDGTELNEENIESIETDKRRMVSIDKPPVGPYTLIYPPDEPVQGAEVMLWSNIRAVLEPVPKATYAIKESIPLTVKFVKDSGKATVEVKEAEARKLAESVNCRFYVLQCDGKDVSQPTRDVAAGELPFTGDAFRGYYNGVETEGYYQLKVELLDRESGFARWTIPTQFFQVKGKPYFTCRIEKLGKKSGGYFQDDKIRFVLNKTFDCPALDVSFVEAQLAFGKHSTSVPLQESGNSGTYVTAPIRLSKAGAADWSLHVTGELIKEVKPGMWAMRREPFEYNFNGYVLIEKSFFKRFLSYLLWTGVLLAIGVGVFCGWRNMLDHFRPLWLTLRFTAPHNPRIIEIKGSDGSFWRTICPARRVIIGSDENCDIALPSEPTKFDGTQEDKQAKQIAEEEIGKEKVENWINSTKKSARIWADVFGRVHIRALTEPSHVYVDNVAVTKGGALLKDETARKRVTLRIGKYKMNVY